MSCSSRTTVLEWTMVFTSVASPSEDVFPAGDWSGTETISLGRGWGELRNKTGNLQVRPGIQFTNDLTNPGTTVTAVGSLMSTNGVSAPTGWTTLAPGAYRFWRPVWLVSLGSGATQAFGYVGGVVQTVAS